MTYAEEENKTAVDCRLVGMIGTVRRRCTHVHVLFRNRQKPEVVG